MVVQVCGFVNVCMCVDIWSATHPNYSTYTMFVHNALHIFTVFVEVFARRLPIGVRQPAALRLPLEVQHAQGLFSANIHYYTTTVCACTLCCPPMQLRRRKQRGPPSSAQNQSVCQQMQHDNRRRADSHLSAQEWTNRTLISHE